MDKCRRFASVDVPRVMDRRCHLGAQLRRLTAKWIWVESRRAECLVGAIGAREERQEGERE